MDSARSRGIDRPSDEVKVVCRQGWCLIIEG